MKLRNQCPTLIAGRAPALVRKSARHCELIPSQDVSQVLESLYRIPGRSRPPAASLRDRLRRALTGLSGLGPASHWAVPSEFVAEAPPCHRVRDTRRRRRTLSPANVEPG